MHQGDRRVLEALVWAVDDELEGLVHDDAPMPRVPGPDELPSVEDRVARLGARQRERWRRFAFFSNLDERPVQWIEDWDNRPGGEPVHRCWYRFLPTASFDDPWANCGRLLVMVDTFQWPAATRAHEGGSLRHIAPSLDLACRFHRVVEAREAQWLLVEARSPAASVGLVAGTASVWDQKGRLLASGGQQMMCRPAPPEQD